MKRILPFLLIISMLFSPIHAEGHSDSPHKKAGEENCYYAIVYWADGGGMTYYNDVDYPVQMKCFFIPDLIGVFTLGLPNATENEMDETIDKYDGKGILIYLDQPFEAYDFEKELVKPKSIKILGEYLYGEVVEIDENRIVYEPYTYWNSKISGEDTVSCTITPDTFYYFLDNSDSLMVGNSYEIVIDDEFRIIWVDEARG